MDKSSKPSAGDRKERYAWRPTGVANVYMRGTKYYYVKMNRGKRHFVPLADSQGRPVSDLPEYIKIPNRDNAIITSGSQCLAVRTKCQTGNCGPSCYELPAYWLPLQHVPENGGNRWLRWRPECSHPV